MKRASDVPPSVASDGVMPGDLAHRLAQQRIERAGLGQEGFARRLEVERERELGAGERERRLLVQQRLQRLRPSVGR